MKLNLRYVIPVMCGTCIALTVSVAAAVSGTPEEDISYAAAGTETEALAFHAYDFTAPAAYSAIYSSETAEETADAVESAESSETYEVTAEPATAEESGDISEETSEGAAESMEVSIETDGALGDVGAVGYSTAAGAGMRKLFLAHPPERDKVVHTARGGGAKAQCAGGEYRVLLSDGAAGAQFLAERSQPQGKYSQCAGEVHRHRVLS